MTDVTTAPWEFGRTELPAGPPTGPELWLVRPAGDASGTYGMDLLDAEERRRATALRRDSDRAVFIAAHT
ncbi:hypothetical protein P8605_33655, partial [Streptomyces sp. T-3]|nr:hypothetical protein [Streptomyces sp. T-3]